MLNMHLSYNTPSYWRIVFRYWGRPRQFSFLKKSGNWWYLARGAVRGNSSGGAAKPKVFLWKASHDWELRGIQQEIMYMHPDIEIVRTYRQSKGLSMRPDDRNTLTCQSANRSEAPRDSASRPRYKFQMFLHQKLGRKKWIKIIMQGIRIWS